MKIRGINPARALSVFLLSSWTVAASPAQAWYRCNTHTHTNAFPRSDANASPEFAAEWYRKHGYQCLFITDHEHVTDVSAVNGRYGESRAFLLMTGEEVSQALTDTNTKLGMRFFHVNALGISKVIASVPRDAAGVTPANIYQRHIDAIYAAGGIPQVNHPNLQWSVEPEDLLPISKPFLLEIWNAFPTSNNLGGTGARGEAALSTEALWDRLLSNGQVVWGTASDDTHDYESFERREATPTPGKAWIVVRAPALSQTEILKAIERGSFYASTGVTLESYETSDTGISMKIAQVPDWNPKLEGSARFVTRFIGAGGRLLAELTGDTVRYRFKGVKGAEQYVRASIVDSDGRRAWTQPVFRDGRKLPTSVP